MLDPHGWTEGASGRLVASPGLTLTCEAEFDPEEEVEHVRARLDGREARSRRDGAVLSWTWPGRTPDAQGWRRQATFDIEGREVAPARVHWVVRLPAALDPATGSSCLERTNIYGGERNEHGAWSWTGPGSASILRVPVAAPGAARVRWTITAPGNLRMPDDLSASLDGSPLDLASPGPYPGVEAAVGRGARGGAAVVELVLETARMFDPAGDARRLGVCVSELELRFSA